MVRLYKIISHKLTIFAVFLSQYLLGIMWLLFTRDANALKYISYEKLLILKTASFFIYLTLAYFSYRGFKIVSWIMAVILMCYGLRAIFVGLFRIEWHQYLVKSHLLIFGIYFIFASVVLIRNSLIIRARV